MRTIRATITIEVPYKNEYMNYGDKLDNELRRVINKTNYLSCHVVAGEQSDIQDGMPVIRDDEGFVE
tara:strand:+ start:210 stop:410 length:201 start_codon:yes stop_codon:yes gene_type:complete